jgi:hypothetical protein
MFRLVAFDRVELLLATVEVAVLAEKEVFAISAEKRRAEDGLLVAEHAPFVVMDRHSMSDDGSLVGLEDMPDASPPLLQDYVEAGLTEVVVLACKALKPNAPNRFHLAVVAFDKVVKYFLLQICNLEILVFVLSGLRNLRKAFCAYVII